MRYPTTHRSTNNISTDYHAAWSLNAWPSYCTPSRHRPLAFQWSPLVMWKPSILSAWSIWILYFCLSILCNWRNQRTQFGITYLTVFDRGNCQKRKKFDSVCTVYSNGSRFLRIIDLPDRAKCEALHVLESNTTLAVPAQSIPLPNSSRSNE